MTDVAADLNAEVTTDGAAGRVIGAGLAQQLAARLDDVVALPDHAGHGAAGHVLDEAGEELLAGKVGVVLLEERLGGLHDLQGDQLEALLLEALDDLADLGGRGRVTESRDSVSAAEAASTRGKGCVAGLTHGRTGAV